MNTDINNDIFVSIYDNCPFWSFHFAYTLLNEIEYKKDTMALDIGTGTGFPAIEIAERLGKSSTVYAIDMWEAALKRAKLKAEQIDLQNVIFKNSSVLDLPFESRFFDLITSNNCLNNVHNYTKALGECFRVLKPEGKLIQTFNLPETFKEFYDVFRDLLFEKGMLDEIQCLDFHIHEKRKNTEFTKKSLEEVGFKVLKATEHFFTWTFRDGSSFLNYSFIKMAFLSSWQNIIPESQQISFFEELEIKLNLYAEVNNGFKLKIPYSCIVAEK